MFIFTGKVDTYGTQQPIALLKLLFERKGFYDRGKDLNWKNIKDIGFLAAMGKAGGGRNDVSTGLLIYIMRSQYNKNFYQYAVLDYELLHQNTEFNPSSSV